MLLATLLALALATSDSTMATAPVPEASVPDSGQAVHLVPPDPAVVAPWHAPSEADKASATRSEQIDRRKHGHSVPDDKFENTVLAGCFVGMGLALLTANNSEACGLGCMGSGTPLLLMLGTPFAFGLIASFSTDDADVSAMIGPDRVGLLLTSELRFPWIPSPRASSTLW